MFTALQSVLLVISLFFLHQTSAISPPQCPESENSYLWRVEVDPPVYLFGTIHVAYESIWDAIPDNVKRAFSGSRDVLLELKLSSRETSMSLMECQLLPGDTDITEVLPLALVKRIDSYLRRIRGKLPSWLNDNSRSTLLRGGQSASEDFFADVTRNWKRKRPIWVLTLISSLSEENVKTWNEPVLDHFLDNVARSLGKNLTALESTNDHCQPLNRLDDAQVEAALRVQLDYLESLLTGPPPTMQRDLTAYRCGDFKALIESQPFLPLPSFPELVRTINITESDMATLHQVEDLLYKRMGTRRNRRMTKSIDSLLMRQRNHTTFIAVGAAHLVGTKSIVDRLRRRNYVVYHVPTSETIEGPNLPGNVVALGDPGSVTQPSILELPAQGEGRPHTRLPALSYNEIDRLIREFFGGGSNRRRRAAEREGLVHRKRV